MTATATAEAPTAEVPAPETPAATEQTSTAVARRGTGSTLVIEDGAQWWTDRQLGVLKQIGVDGASMQDLAVFFHQVTRTGLDPFARQIYMIERQGKWTIQTGIDGFRLIGRRVVDRTRETLEVPTPEWCGPDGVWTEVWLKSEAPAAARQTIIRNGGRFTAVALFHEYKGTKRDGTLNSMWTTKGAHMIGKCAEALAWRKAFPQDLSGLYIAEEMERDVNDGVDPARIVDQVGAPAARGPVTAAELFADGDDTPPADRPVAQPAPTRPADSTPAPVDDADGNLFVTAEQLEVMTAALKSAGATDPGDCLTAVRKISGQSKLPAVEKLTAIQAGDVIDIIDQYAGNEESFRKAMGLPAAKS